MLIPKSSKYRKVQKKVKTSFRSGRSPHSLNFGSYGLKAIEQGWIKSSQIESVRRVLIRSLRSIGKIWIRVFPSKPITGKAAKTRMGKGKGNVQYWVSPVAPGRMLFEIKASISENQAKQVLKKASQKLPILTKFVTYRTTKNI